MPRVRGFAVPGVVYVNPASVVDVMAGVYRAFGTPARSSSNQSSPMRSERVLGICNTSGFDCCASRLAGARRLFFLTPYARLFEILATTRFSENSVLLNSLIETPQSGFERFLAFKCYV